jgi:hypothetical protein
MEPQISSMIKSIQNINKYAPEAQMNIIGSAEKLASKVIPDILKQSEVNSLKHSMSQSDYLNVLAKALEDRLNTAFHPELNIGNNTRNIKYTQSQGVIPEGKGMAGQYGYVHNLEKSPKVGFGDKFGQNIEPAGKYVNLTSSVDRATQQGKYFADNGIKNMETGVIDFKNPLVIDNTGKMSKDWKVELSNKYQGKTGVELSKAIIKDGYDGIITTDKGIPSETIHFDKLLSSPSIPSVKTPIVNPTAPGEVPQAKLNTKEYVSQLKQDQQNAGSMPQTGVMFKIKSVIGDIKRKLVDSTAPIEDTLFGAEKKGGYKVLPSNNISYQIDRSIRSRELAAQFAKDKGLVDVIKGVPDVNALDQYLIAKHAAEVTTTTGRNLTKDQQLIQQLAPTYEPYAQKVIKYGQDLLDYSVQSGLVDAKVADALKKQYPNYVPLNRIFKELEKSQPKVFNPSGVASLSKQTVVQGLKGSERAIVNPTESLLTKTLDAFNQGERNQAGSMLASYKDLPGNPFQLRELKPGESAQNTFSFLDNGVKRTFETTPEIASAAKFLDKKQLGFVGNLFAIPVRLARIGITGINLPFVGSNIAKDQVSAFINSDHALQTSIANPKVFLKSLWTAIGHGGEFDNWIRSAGGGTSFDISRSAPNVTVSQLRASRNIGTKIAYTVTHPGELMRAVENVITRGEEATRLQQFIGTRDALIKEGRTLADANILAADASRRNTTNFSRSGDWGKALNSVFLYMNAGIQGSRTLL